MPQLRTVLVSIIAVAAIAGAGTASAAQTTCKPPAYPGVGYFTSLTVSHVDCKTGVALIKAYYKCRLKHGVKGRCTSKVLGYACKETRNSIPTEIDARVTCTKGVRRIVHTYQQDT